MFRSADRALGAPVRDVRSGGSRHNELQPPSYFLDLSGPDSRWIVSYNQGEPLNSRQSVRARAYTSVGNVGYGFDVCGLCIDAGYDEVDVSRATLGPELTVVGPYADQAPADPALNTAGRAIAELCEFAGISQPLRICVHKGTRPGSGLGSSAASAAAAVVAADALLGLNLSRERLTLLAAEGERVSAGAAHVDNVAAAIYGGFVVFSTDSPPQVMHVTPPGGLRLVVILPSVQVVTKAARGLLPADVSVAEYSRGCARSAVIALALACGDAVSFGQALEGSFFERRRSVLIPGFGRVRAAARAAGAVGMTISGSGPAVVAVAAPGADAAAIGAAMQAEFHREGVASIAMVAGPAPGAQVVSVNDATG